MVPDRLLLDTCAAIWLIEGEPLSEAAVAALNDPANNSVHLSPVTALEFGMLSARGRVKWKVPPLDLYRGLIERLRIAETDMPAEVLVGSSFLPGTPPRDPFDRIVISTARVHGLTILTRDRLILDYARQGQVSALAC